MAIIANPNKQDRKNRTCTHWRIVLFNKETGKRLPSETFHGTREDAKNYENEQLKKLGRGRFIAKAERPTLKKLCEDFMQDQLVRRTSQATRDGYETIFNRHLIPYFGKWQVCTITRKHIREFAAYLLAREDITPRPTPQRVDGVVRHMSILLNFGVREEVIERNPLDKYRKPNKVKKSGRVKRGSYTEDEVQAIIAATIARERAMIGILCFTGIRPGELYALRWLDINVAEKCARIARSWDHRGKEFSTPKTQAGIRTISLSPWVIAQLEAYRVQCGAVPDSDALIFASSKGTPLNPSNVRRDVWLPLIKRAGVKHLDMYSLRHTFASLARASGTESFNVARQIGHARSVIVDTIYADTLPSGLVGMSDRVTARALSTSTPPNNTPTTTPPSSPPSAPVTSICNGVTQPLHKIFGGDGEALLMACSNEDIFMAAAND